jgi:hypothetical protein
VYGSFFSQEETMTTNDKVTAVFKMPDEGAVKEFDWESNRDDENPQDLPWPDENEAKD